MFAIVVFWVAAGLLAYTYAGYPLLVMAQARVRPRPVRRGDGLPTVTAVMAVYNGAVELAAKLVSRAPDITRMLDKLEQRGLIRRDRHAADRRVVQIAITPAGAELLEEVTQPLRECHEKQLGHLSKAELKSLGSLLKAARRAHEPDDSIWR